MELLLSLGAAAGAIASIWGVFRLIDSANSRGKKWMKARRERREAPMKELLAEMRGQRKTLDELVKRMEKMEKADARRDERMEGIVKKVDRLEEGVATLQSDRLNQAYDFYVDKHHPCPLFVKSSLTQMHDQYTAGGHNHLHESYMERLEECPTE